MVGLKVRRANARNHVNTNKKKEELELFLFVSC